MRACDSFGGYLVHLYCRQGSTPHAWVTGFMLAVVESASPGLFLCRFKWSSELAGYMRREPSLPLSGDRLVPYCLCLVIDWFLLAVCLVMVPYCLSGDGLIPYCLSGDGLVPYCLSYCLSFVLYLVM